MPRHEADTDRNWAGLFGIPTIFKAQEVFVRRPTKPDALEGIENPLYRYKIPSNEDMPKQARIPWKDLDDDINANSPVSRPTFARYA